MTLSENEQENDIPPEKPGGEKLFGTKEIPAAYWWQAVFGIAFSLILGIGTLELIRLLARPLALLLLGVAIAAALAKPIRWLEAHRIPRLPAILLVYLVLALFFFLMGWFILPTLVFQIAQVIKSMPAMIKNFQYLTSSWLAGSNLQIGNLLTGQMSSLGSGLLTLPLMLAAQLFDIFLVIFLSIYWLITSRASHRFLLSLFPKERHERITTILEQMGQALGGYIFGAAINGVIMGVASYIGLNIIGVKYPAVLSMFMGLLELLPVLGPVIGGSVMVLVALMDTPGKALITLVFVVVLQQAEGHILVPNIMRSQTNISPVLGVLALFSGGLIGGLLGALIAIPLVSAFQVLFTELIVPIIQRRTGARL